MWPFTSTVRLGLIRAVGSALDETELANIPRERRLRHVEAGRLDHAPKLLLAPHRFVADDVEDGGLASGFHGRVFVSVSRRTA